MARMAMQDVMSFSGMKENAILSQLTIMRAEKARQALRVENFKNLMDTLEMPVEAFFCPCMENQTMEFLQLYEVLAYYTSYAKEDIGLRKKGLDLLNKMKADELFSQGINRQKLISKEVVLLEALGKDPLEIRRLVLEGLDITYPELVKDPFDGDMLIFEEGPLLHSLARTYMQEGDIPYAIALLQNIFDGLILLPQDDKEKERMYAPMLLTLVQCYIQDKNYDEALKVCDTGREIALKRNNGFFVPDFVELKIFCLHTLGKDDELPLLVLQAFAGYTLLRRYNKADDILQFAKEHNITINTRGMETIRPPMPEPTFAHGKTIACDNIGSLMAGLRYDANLTLEGLCEGLCSASALNKLENKPFPLDKVYQLEVLMQRLGRHIDHYFDTFIPKEEFENKQMRDEIKSLLISRMYPEAEELLKVLATKKSYQSGINLQFVELAKASIYCDTNGYGAEHIAMLQNVLNITRKKNFDIGQVTQTRLSYNDITAVNQMASSLCKSGRMREGLRLFEDLLESMDRFYVDEHEKIRMYTTVMRNYSTSLGRSKRYEESLEYAILGESIDVKHRRLRHLPTFAVNRACNMLDLGDKKNCLPYFALSYYGAGLLGRHNDAEIVQKHVSSQLSVGF